MSRLGRRSLCLLRARVPMSAYGPASSRATRMWREIADKVYVRRYVDFDVNVGLVVG